MHISKRKKLDFTDYTRILLKRARWKSKMSTLAWIILTTASISSIAFVGALVLALKEEVLNKARARIFI